MSQELTPAQKRGLLVAEQEQKARNLTVISTIRDMKQSEFFRNNWDSLLIAAPNCLELLGNINSVASTKLAETTPLSPPSGKSFDYLKDYSTLKGGLSQLSSQAAKSFTVARVQMDLINVKSGSVRTQLEIIVAGLADPRQSSHEFRPQPAQDAAEERRGLSSSCYNNREERGSLVQCLYGAA